MNEDLVETANDLVQFLRRHGYCAPGVGPLLAATEEAIAEKTMCTCHGIDRVGDTCIENCGKVRL